MENNRKRVWVLLGVITGTLAIVGFAIFGVIYDFNSKNPGSTSDVDSWITGYQVSSNEDEEDLTNLTEEVKKDRMGQLIEQLNAYRTQANDYEEIYSIIETAKERYNYGMPEVADDVFEAPAAEQSSNSKDASVTSNQSNTDEYSTTNVQVQGVDEGDVVKNDGKYLYIVSNKENSSVVTIVLVDGTKMKKVATLKKFHQIREIYVQENQLVVIDCGYNELLNSISSYSQPLTKTYFYDITDRENPKLINSITQDGDFATARISDGYYYLFTRKYIYNAIDKEEPSTYIPHVDGKFLEAKDICYCPGIETSSYLVIGTVSLDNPKKVTESKAILSNADIYYVSNENIYVADRCYWNEKRDQNRSCTQISKYSYNKGKLKMVAETVIDGTLNNSFSLDEYEGYLRIVATVNDWSNDYQTYNNLYVLSPKMKLVGKITKLAKDEMIYSARFMGDTGYFVTFRQMDPLFSVDLSNPKRPKILGELKITGFSSYLHFYKDNLLLGIGQEAEPDTGRPIGLKISMFDISDPADVKEIDKVVLKDYSYAEALYNHKAVLINPNRNIIGFGAFGYKESSNWEDNYDYMVEEYHDYLTFSYSEEEGFIRTLKQSNKINPKDSYYYIGNGRGTFIGNVLYIMYPDSLDNKITAYSMETYKKLTSFHY